MASEACDVLMSAIKNSQLDFYIQETPYSSYITIRKKFSKLFNSGAKVTEHKMVDEKSLSEEVKQENLSLKAKIAEKEAQIKVVEEECTILLAKLEKTEKEVFKQCEKTSKQKAKYDDETSLLKDKIKEMNNTIIGKEADEVKANKTVKALEKNVSNLESKIQNMENKIQDLNTSRNSFRNERDRLLNEVKKLKENSKKLRSFKNHATQTEAETSEVPDNNNSKPKLENEFSESKRCLSTVSNASQTYSVVVSTSSQTSSDFSSLDIAAETIECVVCNETYMSGNNLRNHTANDHDLILCPIKLDDSEEKDPFVRFVKSVQVDEKYIEERKKFYPAHWDSLEERVKIRLLAQKKLKIVSQKIELNMIQNDYKNTRYYGYGWSYGSIEI